jgi:Domain of Unknown Function (DUF1080)
MFFPVALPRRHATRYDDCHPVFQSTAGLVAHRRPTSPLPKKFVMRWYSLLFVTVTSFHLVCLADEPQETGFIPLVAPDSLTGWEGNTDWFRLEKGVVIAGKLDQAVPRNEFLCTTKNYRNFELRLEARIIGQGDNAGIQFRTRRIPNHHEVSGYQADMGVAWKRSVWGALYDESRRNKMLTPEVSEKAYKPGEWNAFRIRCEGPRIQIWLNDIQTVDYTEGEPDIAQEGVIALQIHSGPPAEAHYRNVRIREL